VAAISSFSTSAAVSGHGHLLRQSISEIARVLALRGAEVLLMPHAARFKPWPDTPEGEAAARRHSHDFVARVRSASRENACFAVLTDQAGRQELWTITPRTTRTNPTTPAWL